MHTVKRAALAAILGLSLASAASAQPYTAITAGIDSVGVEVGGTRFLFGGLLAVEMTVQDTHDAPEDWSEPAMTGAGTTYDYAPEFGAMIKAGAPVTDQLIVWAGAGSTWQNQVSLGRTGATDRFVRHTPWAAGFMCQWKRLVIEAGYNSRRGVVGGIGVTW